MKPSLEQLWFAGEPALIAHRRADAWSVQEAGRALALVTQRPGEALRVRELTDDSKEAERALLAALRAAFEREPAARELRIDLEAAPAHLRAQLVQRGVCESGSEEACVFQCQRAALAQLPDLWLSAARAAEYPFALTISAGKRHPRRPPKPDGRVYERSIPALSSQLSLRAIDPARDLTAFTRWMNEPRVARIWELAGSQAELARYLEQIAADPHTLALIGEFDGEAFGYFELYWAKEDRIAPFYAVHDYDRGVHVLVGESKFRGPARVAAWLSGLAHYAFLDDPRTQCVVAEPRADNANMIAYFSAAGFHRAKAFDFPHKRAALMQLPREVFFDEHCP